MDKYYYLKNGDYLEKATQESGQIALLAKQGDFEVMEQLVVKGKDVVVLPGDKADQFEFFYCLSGELFDEESQRIIRTGDIFYMAQIDEPIYFKVLTDARLLYVVNSSVFLYISDGISQLKDKIKKVEAKDIYTKKHSTRVMDLVLSLVDKIGAKDIDKMQIAFASLFHDLGKIDIPDDILLKPSRLTFEEYEYIKKHPEFGKRLSEDFGFSEVGTIIEQHHERIDGSGYPKGLKADDICIEAKIIGIVDSFDAMTSDRAYRKGRSDAEALKVLEDEAGTKYDLFLVEQFIDMMTNDVLEGIS